MKKESNLLFNKYYLIFILSFHYFSSFSQNWQEVGGGITGGTGSITCLFADSTDNKLYVGGYFSYAGNVNTKNIATWDGLQWTPIGNGAYTGPVYAITKYNNSIIASGNFFDNLNTGIDNWIARWTGTNWDSLRGGVNALASSLSVIDDTLFVGGPFDKADSLPANLMAKWDGSLWTGCQFTVQPGWFLYTIVKFNNEIYLGGNFVDSVNTQILDFAKISGGGQLVQVGSPPATPCCLVVGKMLVYKNELYIIGEFNSSFGNNILKFDGTNFINIGGSDYAVSDMVIYNNSLYVVGTFEHIGGIPAFHIARWDGTTWYSLCTDTFNNNIHSIAILNDELYIAGGFTEINGQSVKRIAKYTGPLSVNDNTLQSSINVYPNPADKNINVHCNFQFNEISLLNSLGEIVYINSKSQSDIVIAISSLKPGVYILKINDGVHMFRKKIVKYY